MLDQFSWLLSILVGQGTQVCAESGLYPAHIYVLPGVGNEGSFSMKPQPSVSPYDVAFY